MLIKPSRLAALGILGINQRNLGYIGRYNKRHYYPLVDNKLKTKLLALEHGISTPELIRVVRTQHQVNEVAQQLAQRDSFVLKPAKGSGGKGILVIAGRDDEHFVKPSGAKVTPDYLKRHMSNILAGLYSLGGMPDNILIEELISCHDSLKHYSYEGVPDIRIIVFKGYPVMAMVRLSTHASDGKANLHQGAVGVGIDIANGGCLQAVQFSRHLENHPDNGHTLSDLRVSSWQDMLLLAASCYEMTQLGYIGVDMVVDQEKGAQLLELNARPGLAIQIANGTGLLPRLKQIESLKKTHATAAQRVNYAQLQFGAAQAAG